MGKKQDSGDSGASQKKRQPTMVDVARHAGVALSTVSHVLNGTAPITDETKKRVYTAIEELDYTPNALARNLRQKRTNVIGIIVPDIENEFYANTAAAIFRIAGSADTVILVDSGYSYEKERLNVEALVQRRVDGLIFLGGCKDEEIIDWVYKQDVPAVLADRRYRDYCSVEFDNLGAMKELVHWLYEKGYRRMGYISESLDMTNLQDRYCGFREGLAECGITMNEQWILNDTVLKLEKVDEARKLMKRLIAGSGNRDMPEILLTSSDMIAVGILDALIQAGYRVPEEIGVVGYDDIRLVRYFNPPVTTVRQDCRELGEQCFQLLNRVMEDNAYRKHLVLKNEIVGRRTNREMVRG